MNQDTKNAKIPVRVIAPFAAIAAFAVALYVYVLPLPFSFDDMWMFLGLRDKSLGSLLTSASGYMYYRPLYLSVLKLPQLIFGYPAPFWIRVLTIALHAANSVLVALTASHFFEGNGKRIAAIAAGLLFAAYPYTYEVMALAANVYLALITFLVTSSVFCYAQYKSQISNLKWLWASLILALIGTATCEYGVITPMLIVVVEVIFRWQRRTEFTAKDAKDIKGNSWRSPRSLRLVPLIYFIFAAIYLAAWVSVPKSRAEPPLILQGLGPMLRDMPVTALYYLQGLTYPLQPLAWPLVRAAGISRELGVGIIAAVTLAGVVAVFARAKRLSLLAFALAWFAIAIAPAWPTLNADYTLNGPRLHYVPSTATTMLWGFVVAILWTGIIHRRDTEGAEKTHHNLRELGVSAVILRIVSAAVLVATLAQSLVFLYGLADLITTGARVTGEVMRAVVSTPPDEPILIVNYPSWIGRRDEQTMFALGTEGMSFLPGYSTMRDMVLLNTRQDRDVNAVTFTNTIKEWKYDQRLGPPLNWNKLLKAVRAARRVWMVEYLPDKLRLSEAGSIQSGAAQPEATFGNRIGVRLWHFELTADELRLELAWTTLAAIDQQLTAFVHIYDPQGKLVAQQDGYPLLGLAPPWLTQIGEVTRDVRRIPLPARLAPGHYTVGVGVYDAETGQRAAALSPTGGRFENDVYLFYGFDVQTNRP